MISVYLANARAIQNKIKRDPSFTQHVRATVVCPKTLIIVESKQEYSIKVLYLL